MILNNLDSLHSYNRLKGTNKKLTKNLEKLSSGLKINRSTDDAAGLAVSEKMRAQITGLNQAQLNAEDGISLVQVADGAMEEIQAMMRRGNELSVQAANGIYGPDEKKMIQDEIDHLLKAIDSIAELTEFNDKKILLGDRIKVNSDVRIVGSLPPWVISGSSMADGYMSETYQTTETYQAGGTITQFTIDHAATELDFSAFDGTAAKKTDLMNGGFYFTCCTCDNHYSIKFTSGTANTMENSGDHYIYNIGIDGMNNASDLLDGIIAATGGNPNNHYTKLTKSGNSLIMYDDRSKDPLPPAAVGGSWVGWSNPAGDITAGVNYGKFGEGVAIDASVVIDDRITLQIGMEDNDILEIKLPSVTTRSIGLGTISVMTENLARKAMESFQKGIDYVSGERGRMGAYQNRLEYNSNNLENVSENIQASESRIRDVDMAKEMANYTKHTILMQTGQSMLAQANQKVQMILTLLQ